MKLNQSNQLFFFKNKKPNFFCSSYMGKASGPICFNAAHYWELDWITNQQISITLSGAKEFDLMAIGDIASADTNSLLVIQLLIPDENAQYYIGFVFSKYSPLSPFLLFLVLPSIFQLPLSNWFRNWLVFSIPR